MENLETYKYVHEKRVRNGRRAASERKPLNAPAPKTFLGMPCETVTFTVPTKERQNAVRQEFATKARAAFLKHLAQTQYKRLRAAGITAKDIKLMEKGKTPNGWNTHHKLSVYGGGTNDFKNLIIMPIPPHDELHHEVIDPQLKGKDLSAGVKIKLPWSDDMVWKRPAQSREKLNAVVAAAALKRRER